MARIPDSHPRKNSLESRQKIVDGSSRGLLADSAMIAHGRGEAFDYLLGERTTETAREASRESAARLRNARRPVISVNGEHGSLSRRRSDKVGCSPRLSYRGEPILQNPKQSQGAYLAIGRLEA